MYTSILTSLVVATAVRGSVPLVKRQDASSSSSGDFQVVTLFPNGPQTMDSSLESTEPIACDIGCYEPAGSYVSCFIGSPIPGAPAANQTLCDQYNCNSTHFDNLLQCLNCIVANGNERPFGYYTNTSITAQPTGGLGHLIPNPNGLIDASLANKMLANVTSHCAAVGSTLSPSVATLTATPTTTGPYYTSYTSGEDVSLTVWPGLESYTINNVVTATVFPRPSDSGSGSATNTGSTSAGSGAAPAGSGTGASSASGSAPSSSSTGAGVRAIQLGMIGTIGLLGSATFVVIGAVL